MGYGFEGSPIAKALKDQPSAGDSQSQKTSDEKPQKSEVMDITLKIYDETCSQSTATVMVLPRPLPNDYALRGFSWVENYFPRNNEDRSKDWFANDRIDDEEKYLEQNSMAEERKDRCLWLGHKIAMKLDIKWLRYDSKTHRFSALDNMAPWLRHDYDSGSEG
ncbi:uncharacterized protein CTHT_0072840 [Thermochaetoides thermophila DSM 1495]|uniref:Uncharacterized protein n=1 Tax=Chaetomium thermophilum (strain DSM 1495 / CBS 144.50 / IMI 039719) TaxID=759272 RepID=G0SHP0_CHATD|nr:hypothetical protein CTHT_0072840 [Thermochaetoides thermophila DSM 1495]EGS16960.1 hypothetical protein CTHT_0072840 [Thermochaetoides thermophila DSM 1495]